jgi:adenosylhomocysteine nucleosidase
VVERSQRIAALAPMTSELRPLVRALRLRRDPSGDGSSYVGTVGGAEVVASKAGVGTAAAAAATERLLDRRSVDHVMVVGIAGGLGPAVEVGDVVVPEIVVDGLTGREHRPAPFGDTTPAGAISTADDPPLAAPALAALVERGVVALDMETSAVAEVCERRGCPWSAVRAISDRADDGTIDEAVIRLVRPDGTPDLPAALRLVLSQPRRLPLLARLARDSTRAARTAAAAAAAAMESEVAHRRQA